MINQNINDKIGKWHGDLGEKIFRIILEQYGLLELCKIPCTYNKTADFLIRKNNKDIAACEVKTSAGTVHIGDKITEGEIRGFLICHERLLSLDVADGDCMSFEDKKEYDENRNKWTDYFSAEEERSKKIGECLEKKIKKKFSEGREQLLRHNIIKVLGLVSFDMADFFDACKALRNDNGLLRDLDFLIFLKVHESVCFSGEVVVKNIEMFPFSNAGKKVIIKDFCFLNKIPYPLRIDSIKNKILV